MKPANPAPTFFQWWKSRPLLLPWVVVIVLGPSIYTVFFVERDMYDTEHLLYLYVPDLVERPWRLLPNLLITPLINLDGEQIFIVVLLVCTFGIILEWKQGAPVSLGAYWVSSAAAALLAGIVWHLLSPSLGHLEAFQQPAERVYNGGSAGAFGLVGGYAAISPRPWLWILLFLMWETGYALASEGFIPVFHVFGFFGGYFFVMLVRRKKGG